VYVRSTSDHWEGMGNRPFTRACGLASEEKKKTPAVYHVPREKKTKGRTFVSPTREKKNCRHRQPDPRSAGRPSLRKKIASKGGRVSTSSPREATRKHERGGRGVTRRRVKREKEKTPVLLKLQSKTSASAAVRASWKGGTRNSLPSFPPARLREKKENKPDFQALFLLGEKNGVSTFIIASQEGGASRKKHGGELCLLKEKGLGKRTATHMSR